MYCWSKQTIAILSQESVFSSSKLKSETFAVIQIKVKKKFFNSSVIIILTAQHLNYVFILLFP